MKAPDYGLTHGLGGCAKTRRPRWTPSDDAKALLETIFSADAFPTFAVRSKLAAQLGIDGRQVQIWFQNRRQRERTKTIDSKSADSDGEAPHCWMPATLQVQLPGGKQLCASSLMDEPTSFAGLPVASVWISSSLADEAQGVEMALAAGDSSTEADVSAMELVDADQCSLSAVGAELVSCLTHKLLPACAETAPSMSATSETCSLSSLPHSRSSSPLPRLLSPRLGPASAKDNGANCRLSSSPDDSPPCSSASGLPLAAYPVNVESASLPCAQGSAASFGRPCAPSASTPSVGVAPPPALIAIVEDLPRDASGNTMPHCAAPSLVTMLEMPGGARALQAAARNMMVANPLFKHPNAPCHELLTQLANILPFGSTNPSAAAAASTTSSAPLIVSDGRAAMAPSPAAQTSPACNQGALRVLGLPRLRDISSEALEVLSSQFFSGGYSAGEPQTHATL